MNLYSSIMFRFLSNKMPNVSVIKLIESEKISNRAIVRFTIIVVNYFR